MRNDSTQNSAGRAQARRVSDGLSRFAVVFVASIAMAAACAESPQVPENVGTVSLRIDSAPASAVAGPSRVPAATRPVWPGRVAGAAALYDSAVVRVFRPGSNTNQETARGVKLPVAGGAVDVSMKVIAESGKKVSVELYDRGIMTYFGVEDSVDVSADATTAVNLTASDILIDVFSVSPVFSQGTTLVTLTWSPVAASVSYYVEESASPTFDPVSYQTITTDSSLTVNRGPGAHYFRVAPVNSFTIGTPTPTRFCYVASGGEPQPSIASFAPIEAPPGGQVTIQGANLAMPGTRVWMGADECKIVDQRPAQLVVEIPPPAQSGPFTLETIAGNANSLSSFVVQRVAVVSGGGVSAPEYADLLIQSPGTLGGNGVRVVPVAELDWRDMGVFDLVLVASDTGLLPGNWGGGVPSRASVISDGGAQVIAIGVGGAVYMGLTNPGMATYAFSGSTQQSVYVADGTLPVFQQPNRVAPPGASTMTLVTAPAPISGADFKGAVPAEVGVYAVLSFGDSRAVLFDWVNAAGTGRTFYWGHAGSPADLSPQGLGCLLNAVDLLLSEKAVVVVPTAAR